MPQRPCGCSAKNGKKLGVEESVLEEKKSDPETFHPTGDRSAPLIRPLN